MTNRKKNKSKKSSSHGSAITLAATDAPVVHIRNGCLMTDSLIIAQEFDRRHDNVLVSIDRLIATGRINRLDFKVVDYADRKGEMRRAIELTQRGALIAMPFIGGRRAEEGQVKLVDAFLAMKEKLAQQLAAYHEMRQKASAGYRMMSEALEQSRKLQGKVTLPHHYMTEAKLVNRVVFGRHEGVDRNRLTPADLMLLEEVEIQNAIWIALGRPYDVRKVELAAFVQALRVKRLDGLQANLPACLAGAMTWAA